MKNNILEQLCELDLNGRQARIYLALLQLGSASAIEIAKYTKFKHPTVYDALDVLKERKLVTETFSGKRRVFHAGDPEHFKFDLERRKSILASILPDLQTLYNAGERKTGIRFYTGIEGVLAIQHELLNVREKEYFYFGSVQEMFKLSSAEAEEQFFHTRIARGIWSNSIRIRSREVPYEYMQPGEKNLRRVRYLPEGSEDEIVSGLYFFDDKVAVSSALKENYFFILESPELNALIRIFWKYMWAIAEEP